MKIFRRVAHAECRICKKIDHLANLICEEPLARAYGSIDPPIYREDLVHLECGLKRWHVKQCECGAGFIRE
jgi:hypothetical protein